MAGAAGRKTITSSPGAERCRKKFLKYFPKGFRDEKYYAWERGYKWDAHVRWKQALGNGQFQELLAHDQFSEIGSRALRALSGTNLLFSFESMALRDAVKTPPGARTFGNGLYKFIYGSGSPGHKFDDWCASVASLPKKQSRVFTHPVTTVFGFIATPETHIFLKPMVTRAAADRYGFDFHYSSRPSWEVYSSLLDFAQVIRRDLADMGPLDMIDIQSFIWVQGSSEYP